MHALRRFVSDKDGRVAIWQAPNPPLIGWFICDVVARFTSTGKIHSGFSFLADALLIAWAYLEITKGVSYFRRALGVIVFIGIAVSHFR